MADGGNNRLGFVECLRLLAALAVFAQHLAERFGAVPGLAGLRAIGPGLAGVFIFFLISGYVVPMSAGCGQFGRGGPAPGADQAAGGLPPSGLASGRVASASGASGGFAPARFLLRRLFRVYPALLAAFGLVWLLGAAGAVADWAWLGAAGLRPWAANLLLVQDYVGARPILGVTWTLSVEFAWYGLFAAAFHRWGIAAGGRLALAMPLAVLALAAASVGLGMRLPLGRIMFLYACVLGLLAFLHDRGALSRRALLGHGGAFVLIGALVAGVEFGLFRHGHVSLVQALWPVVAAPALFLAIVLSPRLRSVGLLARGPLPAAGAASYSIYLLHPVGLAVGGRLAESLGLAAGIGVALAVTAVLAAAWCRLFEQPGIALGRRLLGARDAAGAGGGLSAYGSAGPGAPGHGASLHRSSVPCSAVSR